MVQVRGLQNKLSTIRLPGGLLALGACWLATAILWLLQIRGIGIADGLVRLSIVLSWLATLSMAGWLTSSLWRTEEPLARRRGRLLLTLLVLGMVVRFVGIDHEVEERYYRDEGTYYRHATQINEGEILRARFVYPHFLYYLYAFVLWMAAHFPGLAKSAASMLYGVEQPLAIEWLLMRMVVAGLSAATVLPIFRIGLWLRGTAVASLGSLLFIFSTLFNDGSHLLISDAPSAIFATWTLWATTLLVDRECTRHYLLAGLLAGLAAATKYPAGLVAIAILATWLGLRILERSWSWGLLWAGLASIATFLAVMPSLLFFPKQAFTGGQGLFYGLNQYAAGGWLGVMPQSNILYYLGQLEDGFGLPVLLLGALGLALLPLQLAGDPELVRSRVLWLVAFPVAYLALVSSMNMVVKRNIYPVVPALAIILALGVWRTIAELQRRLPSPLGQRSKAALVISCVLALGALILPVTRTALQTVAFSHPGTRVRAREWIQSHITPGAYVVKESYTPTLSHAEYFVHQTRFVPRLGIEMLQSGKVDLIMVAGSAYHRFFGAGPFKPHHETFRQTYETLFSDHEMLTELIPSPTLDGPRIRIFRGGPPKPIFQKTVELSSADAFVPDPRMKEDEDIIRYKLDGQWSSSKALLAAGSYRLTLDASIDGTSIDGGELRVQTLEMRDVARGQIASNVSHFDLPEDDKYFLRVSLPRGAQLRGLRVEPSP